jgi:hypothetical protein
MQYHCKGLKDCTYRMRNETNGLLLSLTFWCFIIPSNPLGMYLVNRPIPVCSALSVCPRFCRGFWPSLEPTCGVYNPNISFWVAAVACALLQNAHDSWMHADGKADHLGKEILLIGHQVKISVVLLR